MKRSAQARVPPSWAPRPELVDDLEPVTCFGGLRAADPTADSPAPPTNEPIAVFSIHDGGAIPSAALGPRAATIVGLPEVRRAYLRERDWGADLVAEHLARALGIERRLRVELARVALDFGRFPGVSEAQAGSEGYLARRALYPPIADLLTQEAKHRLITAYYDRIACTFARHLAKAKITVAVHTFDPADGTDGRRATRGQRPEIELVTRALAYRGEDLADDVFDPLFPDVLCGPTCNRSFVLQTVLEPQPYYRGFDHSFTMPEGSVEIRVQAWFFYRFLRRRFTAAFPETAALEPYRRVWHMLLDVARRSSEGVLLRGYLHEYREALPGQEALFGQARAAYLEIARFLDLHEDELVHGYRFSTERPSCIGLEVRRDLLAAVDVEAGTVTPAPDAEANAAAVARLAAPAILDHLRAFFPDTASAALAPAVLAASG